MTTYLKLEKRCTLYYLRALFVVVYMWTLFHQSVKLFLNVRIWFINTRRWPSTIYNDNGTNFVGTANQLTKLKNVLEYN
jgi:hypothetical protein